MHKKTFENLWCPWFCCCLSCICNLGWGLGCLTVLIGGLSLWRLLRSGNHDTCVVSSMNYSHLLLYNSTTVCV